MRPINNLKSLAAAGLCVGVLGAGGAAAQARDTEEPTFSNPTQIDNPYLPLSKFHRCTYKGQEGGERQRIERTVLDRTRTFVVDGVPVEAMIVKDRVHAEGKLIEDTRDFFAQDDKGAVRYFGEQVDDIENGHVAGHGGSWLYGRDTNRIGVLMPPRPHVGKHWMSEDAAPITVEHDRMVADVGRFEVQGHTYNKAIKVREYALPDKEVEFKIYAKGVGVIDELPPEGDVGLVGCSG
jgi:hypothetical protein